MDISYLIESSNDDGAKLPWPAQLCTTLFGMSINVVITWIDYIICTNTTIKSLAIYTTVTYAFAHCFVYNDKTIDAFAVSLYIKNTAYMRKLHELSAHTTVLLMTLSWLYVYGIYANNDYMHQVIEAICLISAVVGTTIYVWSMIKAIISIYCNGVERGTERRAQIAKLRERFDAAVAA